MSQNLTNLPPGKPPRWTPHKFPPTLQEDNGQYFRDKNAARYPKHPMEPAVIASLDTDPTLPTKTNIMACGSTLGNLLRFVRSQDKTFRIMVEKVNNTVFLIRRENSPTELIEGVRGYGHSFPEAYTTWDADVKGSATHQRIIRYKFGGLDIVVRFEADGYIKDPKNGSVHPTPSKGSIQPSVDDIVNALATSNVTTKLPKSDTRLQVKKGGSSVEQKAIFDLKTRSMYTKFTKDHLAEELPRLWVSQTPNFILAFHTRGVFKAEDIQVRDVRTYVKKWEKDHVTELGRLAALIHRVVDMVSSAPGSRMEISHQMLGRLDIREQCPGSGDVLSAEVRGRWAELAGREGGGEVDGLGLNEKSELREKGAGSDGDNSDEGGGIEWDEKIDDFTACSSESCGYCGKCSY